MVSSPAAPEIELSVVLPCLNEALTLGACIAEAQAAMASAGIRGEVVIADNGSTDDSIAIAKRLGAQTVSVTEEGYGSALRGGIAAARGRYLVMGDADQSYDFSHLPRFVEKLREGYDLVMGNRFLGGIQPGAMPWKNRYLGNPVLSAVGRLFFRTGIGDFHCGLRGFSAAAFRRMDLRTTGMEFASEMVIKAVLLEFRITEVPTILRPDGRNRAPHLRPWRDGWRHLRFMLLFSPRWLFFYPGLLLMAVGAGVGGALLPGPLRIGKVELDVHTMFLAAGCIVTGFQAVSFAALSKFFTIRAGLRPPEAEFESWLSKATLEAGISIGGGLIIVGAALWGAAVWYWYGQGFGALQPPQILRLLIPGSLFLALGCQMILISFFLGVVRLDTRGDVR